MTKDVRFSEKTVKSALPEVMIMLKLLKKEKIFLGIIIIESLLFFAYYMREISPYYLSGWDQVGYYNNTFKVFELLKNGQVFEALQASSHTSCLFLLTSISYFFFGISKTNGIIIVFLSWVGIQICIYTLLKKLCNVHFARGMLGLYLLTITYMQLAGGIADFRCDIFASAFYLMSMLAMIHAKQFADKKGFNLFVISVFGAILARMNTVALFGFILIVYILYLANQHKANLYQWLKHLHPLTYLFSGAALSYLAIHFSQFLNYQIISAVRHDVNLDVQLSLQGLKAGNQLENYTYVVKALLSNHLGRVVIVIMVCMILVIAIMNIMLMGARQKRVTEQEKTQTILINDATLIAFLYTIAPLLIYSLWSYKSPVVETMIVAPMIVLFGLLLNNTFVRFGELNNKSIISIAKTMAIILFSLGLLNFVTYTISWRMYQPTRNHEDIYTNSNMIDMATFINDFSLDNKNYDVNIFWYPVMGPNSLFLENEAYLRNNCLIKYNDMLSDYNYEIDESVLLERINQSDLLICLSKQILVNNGLPINNQMQNNLRIITELAKKDFIYLSKFETNQGTLDVFAKPHIVIHNTYTDWLAPEFSFELPDYSVDEIFEYTFSGDTSSFVKEPENIVFSVSMYDSGKEMPVLVDEICPTIENGRYTFKLTIPMNKKIKYLEFASNNYFIPKYEGINDDMRHLVLPMPDLLNVIPVSAIQDNGIEKV
jgi:hypothetical protein